MVVWASLVTSFHPKLQAHLTSLANSSCYYNHNLKQWIVDFLLVEDIMCFLASQLPEIKVEDLPRFLVTGLKTYLSKIRRVALDVPLQIESKLLEVFNFVKYNRRRVR
jgi:hypothetical protein